MTIINMKEKKSVKTFLSKYLPRDTSTIFLAALLGILVSVYNELFILIKLKYELSDMTISTIKLFVLILVFFVVLMTYKISLNLQEK